MPVSHPRAKAFFALYLCAIIYLSLFPGQFQLHPKFDRLIWAPLLGRRGILDFILNIFFYVPLGVSGFLAGRRSFWTGVIVFATGGLLSCTMEWLQLWTPSRFGNLSDLAANTLGTLFGVAVGCAASRKAWQTGTAPSLWRLPSTAWLLLALWLIWQTFPFIPTIALARLIGLRGLLSPWSWLTAAEAFLGFAVLRIALGKSPWLWIAYAALLAQAFLLDRALSPAALLGASLGWSLAKVSGKTGEEWLGLILPVWLVFEELRPFIFSAEKTPFSWLPFASWPPVGTLAYYPTIFGKLFLYLSVIWGLRGRHLGWSLALGIPAVILIAGEWAQQYLPGRTPESTDILLLLAGATLLALCTESKPSQS
jgi:VanZ family protein